MIGLISGVFWETWEILKDASVFLIFGFLLAGALAVLVPKGLLVRLVGTGRVRSVLWASVLGAPLPLCSCGVLPRAAARAARPPLRDRGFADSPLEEESFEPSVPL